MFAPQTENCFGPTWSNPTPAIIPTPIVRGDLVFFSIGYKRGGTLFKQVPTADGGVDVKEIYPLDPRIGNKHGGVVLVDDYVYGDTEDSGVPFCAELMTGHLMWKKRGSGRGSAAIAAADGHLYLHFANGTMVLAPGGAERLSRGGVVQSPRQRRTAELVASRDRRRQALSARAGPDISATTSAAREPARRWPSAKSDWCKKRKPPDNHRRFLLWIKLATIFA